MNTGRMLGRRLLGLAAVLLTVAAVDAEAPRRCDASRWSLKNHSLQPDGSLRESAAESTRYCLLDGRLEMDEFRALDRSGAVTFRGVSFSYAIDGDSYRTLWVMVGDPGYTLIENERRDGRLHSHGQGIDGAGKFREKSVTVFPDEGRYRFEMDRNYVRVGRWLEPFNVIEATRTDERPPPLPEVPAPRLERLREGLPAVPQASFAGYILDGHAHVTVREQEDGPPLLEYSVPAADDELLIHSWRLGSEKLEQRRPNVNTSCDSGR